MNKLGLALALLAATAVADPALAKDSAALKKARAALVALDFGAAQAAYFEALASDGVVREMALLGLVRIVDARGQAPAHGGSPAVVAFLRGRALEFAGAGGPAAKAYREAVGLDGDFPEAYLGLYRVLTDAGSKNEALKSAVATRRVFTQAHRVYQDTDLGHIGSAKMRARYLALHQRHPKDPRFFYLLGRKTDDPKQSQPLYDAGMGLDPAFYWNHHGSAFQQKGAARLDAWRKAFLAGPEFTWGARSVVDEAIESNGLDEVRGMLTYLWSAAPSQRKQAWIHWMFGRLLHAREEMKQAAVRFKRAIELGQVIRNGKYLFIVIDAFPDFAPAYARMADIYIVNKDYRSARQYADSGRDADPGHAGSWDIRAELAWKAGEPGPVVRYFAQKAVELGSFYARRFLIWEALVRGDAVAAAALCDQVLGKFSTSPYYKGLRAAISTIGDAEADPATVIAGATWFAQQVQNGRLAGAAAKAWRRAAENPEVLVKAVAASLRWSKANSRYGDAAAIGLFCGVMAGKDEEQRATRLAKNMGGLRRLRHAEWAVAVVAGSGLVSEARLTKAVLGALGSDAKACNDLGWELALWNVAIPTAVEVLRHGVSLAPGDANSLDSYSLALRRAGRLKEAAEVQLRAIDLIARNERAAGYFLRLGDIYVDAKETGNAKTAYKAVVHLDPHLEEVVFFRLQLMGGDAK